MSTTAAASASRGRWRRTPFASRDDLIPSWTEPTRDRSRTSAVVHRPRTDRRSAGDGGIRVAAEQRDQPVERESSVVYGHRWTERRAFRRKPFHQRPAVLQRALEHVVVD